MLPRECPDCGTLLHVYGPEDNVWSVECERQYQCGVVYSNESADDAVEQWLEERTR